MKKLLFIATMLLMSIGASAFDFDGINLNGNVIEVTRQISQKGYAYDAEKDCLVGVCQGTEIYLSINYRDVNKDNKIGQLIVEVPMTEKNALDIISKTFNVVYHQVSNANNEYVYQVSEDGTKLIVSATAKGVKLTYNTPYYKAAK